MTLSVFIEKHYHVRFASEGITPESAEEFYLGDNHEAPGFSIINSLFIDTFAKKSDAVLVEAIPALKQIHPDEALLSLLLKTKAKICGWDLGSVKTLVEIDEFSESADLEIQSKILLREIVETDDLSKKSKLKAELVEIIKKMDPIQTKLEEPQISEQIMKKVMETFQMRTQSMISALESEATLSTRRFVIAGRTHLNLSHPPEFAKGAMKDFGQFLKLRKAVILFPKEDVAEKLGMEFFILGLEATCEAYKQLGNKSKEAQLQQVLDYLKRSKEFSGPNNKD